MLNKTKLRVAMLENGVTQKDVAKEIGISVATFSRKMSKGTFGIDEANAMIKYLQIKNPNEIFFAEEVT